MFNRPASFESREIIFDSPGTVVQSLAGTKAKVVVQAASVQSPSVIHSAATAWGRLVMEGGLSVAAAFQTLLSSRVGKAVAKAMPEAAFINCCYPDVVNAILVAQGVPLACGVGNVAILATMFEGELGIREPGQVRVLAHYQLLGPWRGPAEERTGRAPRVWLRGKEITDVYRRFARLKLTREPVIEISGASGVPLMLALAGHGDCVGHAPGPEGLPGGYPVKVRGGKLSLDLPTGLGRDEAVAWNASFEEENGMLVDADGCARYHGRVRDLIAAHSREMAAGFHVNDLESVVRTIGELRARLGG